MIRYKVELTSEERNELETIVSKGTHQVSKIKEAMILLACDEGQIETKHTSKVISEITHVSTKTIERLKKKFVEEGYNAVINPKKSRRVYAKKFDGDLEAHLVAVSCGEAPAGFANWSLRMLADKMVEMKYVDEISHESVRQILKKTNLSLGKRSDG